MIGDAKPSHVFMTADAVGGVWTYAVDLAAGLAKIGVRTTLAVLGPPPSAADGEAATQVPGLQLIDTGLPLDWLAERADEIASAGEALVRLANASGADLVHLNSPALAADGGFSAPVVGACHSDLASWWAAVRPGETMPEDFRWRTEALARGYAACDALLAPTAAVAAETARLYGVRPAVVRNGRAAAATPSGSRHRMVVTTGRLWDAGKNVATLDEAVARLDAPVVALGPLDGPHGERVRLSNLQTTGRIAAGEVMQRLTQARVFCSLATYEPFGLGVLEAAQAGCALVLSDIPTFRELWSGAATLVQPHSPDQVAAALQRLLDDPEEAARFGAASAERAQRYTVDAMVNGVLAAYASLLAGASKEAAA